MVKPETHLNVRLINITIRKYNNIRLW